MTDVSAVQEHDAPQGDTARDDSVQSQAEGMGTDEKVARLQVSISLRSLIRTSVIVALVVAVGVLGWLYLAAQRQLHAQTLRSDNNAHAEKIALDYAVNAAEMNFQDLNAWKGKLVAGTSPELKDKLTKAATSMEQILVPLQWNSTARPLVAKVRSETAAAYVVDSFVSVLTKTAQAPEGLQSTATYSVTIDRDKNWQITDVGGLGAVVEEK
jgi:hypothetical protein